LPLAAAVVLVASRLCEGERERWSPPPRAFDGASTDLEATTVLPTLDTPLPATGNALWCASFPLAWRKLQTDIVQAPLRVQGAEAIAARLNQTPVPALPAGTAYVRAGRVTPDLFLGIQQDVKRLFPQASPPRFEGVTEGLLAYAYLAAQVKFQIPFFDADGPLAFVAPDGDTAEVRGFGIREKDDYAYYALRRQVGVLFAQNMYQEDRSRQRYAVDLDTGSAPFRLVLACLPRPASFPEARKQIEALTEEQRRDYTLSFGSDDVLLVPDMAFRVTHHFTALEGRERQLLNPGFEGLWVATAMQAVEFRLDKSGADLKAEAEFLAESIPSPSHFVFDRPFLLQLEVRKTGEPVFAMWVEDPELLVPAPR
jgi:hypothetical protein